MYKQEPETVLQSCYYASCGSEWCHLCTLKALVSTIFWPHFWLTGGWPYPLAIRHQVIFDAALGAPVFCQLILCYLLQMEHRHLSWPTPHSATRGPFKVILQSFILCCFFFVLPFVSPLNPGGSFLLLGMTGWCSLLPILLLRLALLLLAYWGKILRDHLEKQCETCFSGNSCTLNNNTLKMENRRKTCAPLYLLLSKKILPSLCRCCCWCQWHCPCCCW